MENPSDLNNIHKISSEYIPASSHYALKLAFKTLKERCEKLQHTISVIEEENMRLKGSHSKKKSCEESNPALIIMEKKLDELSRQKSQLSHHIFVLANENKCLWDSTLKLSQEKELLLNQLKDISTKLNAVNHDDDKTEILTSVSTESVKTIDLPSENSSGVEIINDISQNVEAAHLSTLEVESNLDLCGINNQLKDIMFKLHEDKTVLKQQQAGLKKALDIMKKIYQGMKLYALYLEHLKTDEESTAKPTNEVSEMKNGQLLHDFAELNLTCKQLIGEIKNSNEIFCPICNKMIVDNAQQSNDFKDHFMHHIQECSETDLFLKSFEII